MAVGLPPPVVDAAAAIGALLALDPQSMAPSQQLAVLDELLVLGNRFQAATARMVAAVDASEATVTDADRTTKSYLVEVHCLDPGDAGKLCRLGRGLPFAPLTEQAFAAGDINSEHALLILKVLRHVKDDELREAVECELVKLALGCPPYVVSRAVDQVLAMLGVESSKDAHERRFRERGVGVDETFGGTGSLNGTLTAELCEKLRVFFTAYARPRPHQTARAHQLVGPRGPEACMRALTDRTRRGTASRS